MQASVTGREALEVARPRSTGTARCAQRRWSGGAKDHRRSNNAERTTYSPESCAPHCSITTTVCSRVCAAVAAPSQEAFHIGSQPGLSPPRRPPPWDTPDPALRPRRRPARAVHELERHPHKPHRRWTNWSVPQHDASLAPCTDNATIQPLCPPAPSSIRSRGPALPTRSPQPLHAPHVITLCPACPVPPRQPSGLRSRFLVVGLSLQQGRLLHIGDRYVSRALGVKCTACFCLSDGGSALPRGRVYLRSLLAPEPTTCPLHSLSHPVLSAQQGPSGSAHACAALVR